MTLMRLSTAIAPHPRSAFTRADLATALAVLACLAALLLPALARETHVSQRTSCTANLRLILQAVALYSAENSDFLPHPTWGSVSGSPGPNGWAYATRLTNGSIIPNAGLRTGPFAHTNQLPFYAAGQLAPYLPGQPALFCPTDWYEAQLESAARQRFAQREVKLTSYTMNGAACGYGASKEVAGAALGATYKAVSFTPQDLLFWEVDEFSPFNFNDAASNPLNQNEGISQRHQGFASATTSASGASFAGRLGGDVNRITSKSFLALQKAGTSDRPNELLCGPGYQ